LVSIVWFAFVAITVAAAGVDLATYRIPNALVVSLVALFLVVVILHLKDVQWLSHLGSLTLVLGAGIVGYAFGQMAAGDVKLLSAIALWSGAFSLLYLLFWVSLCGFMGMLVILMLRILLSKLKATGLISRDRVLPQVFAKGRGIPYGIGIGPGAIIASFSFPSWLWQT